MRSSICAWIVCVGVACAGVALAAPKPRVGNKSAGDKHTEAKGLTDTGDYEKALAVIEDGLASAPTDTGFLLLKAQVLLKQKEYLGALAAAEADLAAGATGANKRNAEQIVKILSVVKTTFFEITLANGPASIYLDRKSDGELCVAAPTCNKQILPDTYRVIAERPGFDTWTGRATVAANATTKLAITLVEKSSLLTVQVTPPGANVTVDGTAYSAPTKVAAGSHAIVASLAGHRDERRDALAHDGKPVAVNIALTPVVPVRVEPSTATLAVDGQPAVIQDGAIALAPGPHELVARAPGRVDGRIQIPAVRPADYQISVVLDPVPPPRVPVPGPGFTPRRKIALAVGGLGVAATAGGVVLGLLSKQRKDDAFKLCPSSSTPCTQASAANSAYESGRSRALQADIAFGVAGGAAIAAAVLWFTGAPESQVAVTPRLGPVAGLDLAVRF